MGLVERDLVDGAVGLDLDLLGVDHLNGGNDAGREKSQRGRAKGQKSKNEVLIEDDAGASGVL